MAATIINFLLFCYFSFNKKNVQSKKIKKSSSAAQCAPLFFINIYLPCHWSLVSFPMHKNEKDE